jgi:hypothetical protein
MAQDSCGWGGRAHHFKPVLLASIMHSDDTVPSMTGVKAKATTLIAANNPNRLNGNRSISYRILPIVRPTKQPELLLTFHLLQQWTLRYAGLPRCVTIPLFYIAHHILDVAWLHFDWLVHC